LAVQLLAPFIARQQDGVTADDECQHGQEE
jgi:hypothetical protein